MSCTKLDSKFRFQNSINTVQFIGIALFCAISKSVIFFKSQLYKKFPEAKINLNQGMILGILFVYTYHNQNNYDKNLTFQTLQNTSSPSVTLFPRKNKIPLLQEDRLRISINTFCEACDELVETSESSESALSKVEQILNPEVVSEAFRPKLFEPSLLPPQTLSVSKVKKKPMVGATEGTKDTMVRQYFYSTKELEIKI